MTKQTKILIGVGVVALAYYLFKDKFKGGGASTQLSKETIDCLRSKMIVANGKITEEQFNNLVANNFSESSISSLVETLSKVANPKADIQKLKNSAMAEFYSLIKNCKDGQKTSMPQMNDNPNLQTTIYTCKDGIKVTQTIDRDKAMVMKFSDPCLKHGGILSYTDPTDVPYQNNKGGCPVGFKEIPMNCKKAPCGVTCVPYAKPNGSF
jgi:hypothetical protein